MKRAEKRAKIKAARATQQINRAANKQVALLREQLKNVIQDNKLLEAELKKIKTELVNTSTQLKQSKVSHQQLRETTIKIINKFTVNFKGFGAQSDKKVKVAGPFDIYNFTNGYLRAAQAAGNRIELNHPGFFAKYSVYFQPQELLTYIWDIYASQHEGSEFYSKVGDSYVDEELYGMLVDILDSIIADKEGK